MRLSPKRSPSRCQIQSTCAALPYFNNQKIRISYVQIDQSDSECHPLILLSLLEECHLW
jgi:hypothetical protein